RDMAFNDAATYRESLEAGEAIATNILADRLKRLERQGVAEKSRDPGDSRRWIYTLSPKGLDLLPALVELIRWDARYHRTEAPAPVLREMTMNRERFIAGVRAAARRKG
ncbi:MAG: winged helix-turn-helix transcriptional regulator, partial [Gammaproteobacteria bacterium]